MIDWFYEGVNFQLANEEHYSGVVNKIVNIEGGILGNLSYIFCDDKYLLKLNNEYLQHDEYTDIITFDYCEGGIIIGDIFISVERVKENAARYKCSFEDELQRVIAHGVLHLLGYGDKTEKETLAMRAKETEMLKLFHVEH